MFDGIKRGVLGAPSAVKPSRVNIGSNTRPLAGLLVFGMSKAELEYLKFLLDKSGLTLGEVNQMLANSILQGGKDED